MPIHRALLGSWRVWLVLGLIAGISTPSAGKSYPYRVVVNPARCGRLSAAQQKWLTPEWAPYLDYTRICPVRNPKRETAVLLVSVHADLYYKAQPGQSVVTVQLPSPLLFLPSGGLLGSLPYNFPDDPPAELRVTFVQWDQGFPLRLELFVTDPRASGNRSLPPLVWDNAQKKYLSGKDAPHD